LKSICSLKLQSLYYLFAGEHLITRFIDPHRQWALCTSYVSIILSPARKNQQTWYPLTCILLVVVLDVKLCLLRLFYHVFFGGFAESVGWANVPLRWRVI